MIMWVGIEIGNVRSFL
jgi:hypothetical protein